MIFSSLEFALFLPIVFGLYWFVTQGHLRLQNALLLVASYVFYGWWDWRFLSLIFLSSLVDYAVGLRLSATHRPALRRLWLFVSLAVNLGALGFFKYYNFFADSLVEAFAALGVTLHARTLDVILPVGISFYTFQTLSYTVDVYRRQIEPTRDALAFFTFVAFFPQLVAGPIERASSLLPQFQQPRRFEPGLAADGCRQMLYGFFKKVIIADGCAPFVDQVFGNPAAHSGSELLLGAVFFAFQIYGDFSGYSDIAVGTAKILGFRLMINFAFPYFSRDIAEFWRRWHISLSTWFRDYLFIPLGGSRGSKWTTTRNVLVTFTVSGLWHGANWTFVVWGLLNAIFYLPMTLLDRQKRNVDVVAGTRALPTSREAAQLLTIFAVTVVAWVFFRANSLEHAFAYLAGLFSPSLLSTPSLPRTQLAWVGLFVGFEWIQRRRRHGLEVHDWPRTLRWLLYWAAGFSVLTFYSGENPFIYFQF